MSEFTSWGVLATYGGALGMVMLLTQFTKDLSFTKRIPTQVWSYILALIVLFPALAFTDALTLDTAVLTLFNGIIVSIAANGGFAGIQKIFGKTTDGDLLIDTSGEKELYRFEVGDLDKLINKKTITLLVKPGSDLSA